MNHVHTVGGPSPGPLPEATSHGLLKYRPPWVCRRLPAQTEYHRYIRTEDPFVYEYAGPCPDDDHDWPPPC